MVMESEAFMLKPFIILKFCLTKKIFGCRIHPIKGKGALEHHLRGAFLFIHTNTFTVQRRASRERYHL